MAKRPQVTPYRLGDDRRPGEGVRIGVTRYPPRGVARADWSRRNFFDVWYPNLAPSAALIRWLRAQDTENPAVWRRFFRAYEREMRQPAARANIALLAAIARETPLAIGCYCEDESHCHRTSLLRLIGGRGGEGLPRVRLRRSRSRSRT
jgi:uncharacterized protein YeaO (DUF488 family)